MLSPEYLAGCADTLLGIYDNLQTSIAVDIAMSIDRTGRLMQTAAYQTERIQAAGKVLQDVSKEVAGYSKLANEEIQRIYEEAAQKNLVSNARDLIAAGQFEGKNLVLSTEAKNVLEATIRKTQGDLRNLTMTTASNAYGSYISESNNAYMKVVHGGYAPEKAIADAVKNAAKEGAWVTYAPKANGSVNHSRLDVAVRRNIQTGVNQTCAKLTEMQAEDLGAEYYEVSAHEDARPDHAEWQGQVYKIHGADEDYENFEDATGYGDVDGLCGVNCRHSFYPFFPDISKRNYTDADLKALADTEYEYGDETYTGYEASQIQRGFERSIRESKRELASYDAIRNQSGITDAQKEEYNARFKAESANLKATEKAMKSFCEATNRNVDTARTSVVAFKDDETGQVLGWTRSLSQQAVWAAKG